MVPRAGSPLVRSASSVDLRAPTPCSTSASSARMAGGASPAPLTSAPGDSGRATPSSSSVVMVQVARPGAEAPLELGAVAGAGCWRWSRLLAKDCGFSAAAGSARDAGASPLPLPVSRPSSDSRSVAGIASLMPWGSTEATPAFSPASRAVPFST